MRNYILIALIGGLVGCGSSQSPEQQVREVVTQLEAAAEARDTGAFMKHVSKEYRDVHGQGRDDAMRYLRGYFIANQSIHLLTRVQELSFPADDEARATVQVGMVGRDVDAATAWDVAANVRDFDLVFRREDGEWRVSYAKWERSDY